MTSEDYTQNTPPPCAFIALDTITPATLQYLIACGVRPDTCEWIQVAE